MPNLNNYQRLQQMLDAHPFGARASKTFDEIIRILYTEDEVAIMVHMGFRLKSVSDIASSASLREDIVQARLNNMLDKASIICKTTSRGAGYAIAPMSPELYDRTPNRYKGTPQQDKVNSIWHEYKKSMIESLAGKPTPLFRVIPVETAIHQKSLIVPHQVVSDLIKKSGTIAVFDCACRMTSPSPCSAPVHVCLQFGKNAEFVIERSLGKQITVEEALTILDETEKAGLIHCGNNNAEELSVICNCCSCCCIFIRGLVEFGNSQSVATSYFEALVDEEKCNGCGICYEKRCKVKAMVPSHGKAVVESGRCIGCGLCSSACPVDAVELVARQNPPYLPANMQEMVFKVLSEKGKLEAFMDIMKK